MFLARIEPAVLALQRRLLDGSWRPGIPTKFRIRDPKPREITAAPFEDRVVHHALIDVLEPQLDRRMVPHSFACRRGKGQHAALRWAQRLLRENEWFLKLDVQGFFPSLAHDVVLATLQRVLKDRRALALCGVLVQHGGEHGRGLPIGSLSSQWFANLVLDRIDHWLVEELRGPGYVRYMDDFVLFGAEKAGLRTTLPSIAARLAELRLDLKDRATLLAPVQQGLPFLGCRLYRSTIRLRPDNLARCRARLRHRQWQHRQGQIDDARLADCVRSSLAHMQHANSLGLRRDWFATPREWIVAPSNRCNRGGNFDNDPENAQSGYRNNDGPSNRNDNLGLRPAKTS